jgi:hypothetical protein
MNDDSKFIVAGILILLSPAIAIAIILLAAAIAIHISP